MDQTSIYKSFSLNRHLQCAGFARLVSDLVNPLLLPPFVIGLLSWKMGLNVLSLTAVIAVCLFFYTVIPVSATFYLLKKKQISSIDLPERKSRTRLFLFSIACAGAAYLCFTLTPGLTNPLLGMIALIFLVNPSIGFLINFKWKMSIHTAALSTAGGIFIVFSFLDLSRSPVINIDFISIFILMLLLPLVIWARYRLKIHSMGELIGGSLAGFLLTVVELSLLLNLW